MTKRFSLTRSVSIVACAALSISTATAQGPAGPTTAAAARVLQRTLCGPLATNVVVTENAPTSINAVAFVNIPGAVFNFAVPAGASRCVKVLFTGETSCRESAVPDFCYIRALINGVELPPQGAGFQIFDSEDSTASAHAYEWVGRVGPGNYVLVLQRRVGNAATVFTLDDWTFDVEVHL